MMASTVYETEISQGEAERAGTLRVGGVTDMWCERGLVYGVLFEFPHEKNCVRRRHSGPHSSAMYL